MAGTRMRRLVDRWQHRSGTYYRDPRSYWDARHREHGDGLRGVGCVLLDEAGNSRDYDTKWAHVCGVLERELERGARRILDAGCGVGWFTEQLSMIGFTDVKAFDFSAAAAAQAREKAPSARVSVSALEDFRSDRRYDVVMCIDVLFHVVDDERWSHAVSNLASLVAPGGALLVQDSIAATGEEQPAPHVRIRPVERYRSLLEGWTLESLDAYDLTAEAVGKHLMLFRR
jgi:2-polyprenyl-3-methyl-5-hydroxy-6-metoxy-1,4-benzoquinol methylase